MLTLSENPPILPESVDCVKDLQGTWLVAHTKSRFEKAFAWDLAAQGIGYFLPMSPRITFSGGRKRKGMAPLFPSYVFFCGDEQARWQALRTNRLCRVIPVPQQEAFVNELEQICTVLSSGQPLELYPVPAIGARCRVTGGPFKGLVGIITDHNKRTRLVLKVNVLGQGASLDIDSELLEPADDALYPAGNGVHLRGDCLPPGVGLPNQPIWTSGLPTAQGLPAAHLPA
jgi:transcription antitermination factor NusG